MSWCLTLIVSISLRQVTCVEQDLTFPIAIPRTEAAIPRGTWPLRSVLFKPKAYYNGPLSPTKIGYFVSCLDVPGKNTCFHGWHDTSVLGKAVSSECFRLSKGDMANLWFRLVRRETIVIVK